MAPQEGGAPQRAQLETLADTLWSERHLVEQLLYKLVVAKLILAADERRFVSAAIGEVERAVARIRDAEHQRQAALAAVARDWGRRSSELTLSVLAEEAPEQMRSVFEDHRTGFQELSTEIEETAAENRRLASGALSNVQEAIEALTGAAPTGPTYTAEGRAQAATAVSPSQWDTAL